MKSIYIVINNGGDKHDDFTFPIVNFLFIGSNIPAAPVYEIFHNSYVIIGRVPSIVIFWNDISC